MELYDPEKYDAQAALDRLLLLDQRWFQTRKVKAEQRSIIDDLNAYDEYLQPLREDLEARIARKRKEARNG